tara:strand:- start:18813 stop:19895 length:1083 start_codon:yes stop_codon:yes gene_type:complete
MKKYNFSAGPACLPDPVLEAASLSARQFSITGMSILEVSHRSKEVVDLFKEASDRFRSLLDIPKNYHILWLQGGASTQFSMVPLNILPDNGIADFIETGSWSTKAIDECNKLGCAKIIGSSKEKGFTFIPKTVIQNEDSEYLHITSNNTIYGTQYKKFPEAKNKNNIIVADMSSDILSRPFEISKFGIIYAGAQKNIGPAGVTVVIVKDDLLNLNLRDMPTMMNYQVHVEKESMFNTPPVFSVFVVNETLKWLEKIGGLEMMNKINKSKAEKLYNEIESNPLFISPVMNEDRSLMNVPFVFSDEYEIKDSDFLEFCAKRGLMTLKGHRSVGGFRASIYNAMPESGVDMLIEAMRDFKKNI